MHFIGTWRRVPVKTVRFEFKSSDDKVELPAEINNTKDQTPPGLLPDSQQGLVGDSMRVPNPNKFDKVKAGDYVWTFQGWSDNVTKFFWSYNLILQEDDTKNVVVGTWKPERAYTVKYSFLSENGATLPKEVMDVLPKPSQGHLPGEEVTAPSIPDVYVQAGDKEETWHLKKWNVDKHTMGNEDFTFVATWEMYPSYTVTYEYVYTPDDKDVPDALKASLPQPKHGYKDKESVTGPALETTMYASTSADKRGFWVFKGWEENKSIAGQNLTLKGTWEFEPATWKGTVNFDGHMYYNKRPLVMPAVDPKPEDELGFHHVWSNLPKAGFLPVPQYFVGWALKPNANPETDTVYYPSQKFEDVFPNGIADNSTLYEVRVNLATVYDEVKKVKPYFNQSLDKDDQSSTLPGIKIAEAKGFDDPDANEHDLVAYYNKNLPDEITLNLSASLDIPKFMANFSYINPNNIFYEYAEKYANSDVSKVFLNVDLDSRIHVANKPVDIVLKSYNFRPDAVLEGNVTKGTKPFVFPFSLLEKPRITAVEGNVITGDLGSKIVPENPETTFSTDLHGLNQFSLR